MNPRQLKERAPNTLGARLTEARTAEGLTQKQAAAALGWNLSELSEAELGTREPRLPRLIQLANLYRVTLDWLAGRSGEGGPG